jgi:hypothetical protein
MSEVLTWGGPETEVESIFAQALIALLAPNIDPFERPNSGVVIHYEGQVFLIRYEGGPQTLHMTMHSEPDDPVMLLNHGQMVVLEDSQVIQ